MAIDQLNKDKTNRLSSTRIGGKMTADYWENIFTAKERGKHVVWYNGAALNPLFQAAGLEWCHGEAFAARLTKEKIPHQVLNARYHEQEAFIISQAGRPGAVTIATNMAGRGTDIMLGGNPEMMIREQTANVTDEAERQKIIARIRGEIAANKEMVREAGGYTSRFEDGLELANGNPTLATAPSLADVLVRLSGIGRRQAG